MDQAAVSHGPPHNPPGAALRVYAVWWSGCSLSLYSIQVSFAKYQAQTDRANSATLHFKTDVVGQHVSKKKHQSPSPLFLQCIFMRLRRCNPRIAN